MLDLQMFQDVKQSTEDEQLQQQDQEVNAEYNLELGRLTEDRRE